VKFLKDSTVKDKFAKAKKLSDVKVNDYDAIYYVGGLGPVLDLATDPVNIKFASEVNIHSTVMVMLRAESKPTSFTGQARSPQRSATDLRKLFVTCLRGSLFDRWTII
jgi:hypothetical protein